MWITPTNAGEKALVLTRAGTCAEDFEAFSGELASACYARRVNVARHRKWAHLITIEIIRREPPASSRYSTGSTGRRTGCPCAPAGTMRRYPISAPSRRRSRWPHDPPRTPHDPPCTARLITANPSRPPRPLRTTRAAFAP
ncbi:hypothetical protein ACFQX6_38765 [Streptosporangium lutulentum]